MSEKTMKKYFITNPNGSISGMTWTRANAREYRIAFQEKIVKVEYTVKPNGTIEIVNQKQVR